MKTFLFAMLLLHTGCASVASETLPVADPQSKGPTGGELKRSPAAARPKEPAFAVAGGRLMMSDPDSSAQPKPLWPIGEGPISWTRFVGLDGGGYAVVLRQRDTILVGTLDAGRKPLGELGRIPARHVIGTPAVAANGDVAIVTWAQGETTGCTSLMGTVFAPGEGPGPVQRIPGTECTEERSARAPVLRAADGRFVLAFTEIGVWSSQSVAMVLEAPAMRGSGVAISSIAP